MKNYISLVAITTREILIFTLLNENKSCIDRKKLEYPLYIIALTFVDFSLDHCHVYNYHLCL